MDKACKIYLHIKSCKVLFRFIQESMICCLTHLVLLSLFFRGEAALVELLTVFP